MRLHAATASRIFLLLSFFVASVLARISSCRLSCCWRYMYLICLCGAAQPWETLGVLTVIALAINAPYKYFRAARRVAAGDTKEA